MDGNEVLGNYLLPLCLPMRLDLLLKQCGVPVGKYTQVHSVNVLWNPLCAKHNTHNLT